MLLDKVTGIPLTIVEMAMVMKVVMAMAINASLHKRLGSPTCRVLLLLRLLRLSQFLINLCSV
jgi:hypothetical protein